MKKKYLRIFVPILIVLVTAGIWLLKNVRSGDDAGDTLSTGNKDFLLEADSIELETLKAYQLPIVIDFGSDGCLPCQQMAHLLTILNGEMQGKAIIKYIDAWEHSEEIVGFPVQVIPTQLFINPDGSPYVPEEDISLDFLLYENENGEHVFTVHQGELSEAELRAILADMGAEP